MNQFSRNMLVWAVIIAGMMMLYSVFQQPQERGLQNLSYSQLLASVDRGEVASVTIQGQELVARMTDGSMIKVFVPQDDKLVPLLMEKKVEVRAEPMEGQPWYVSMLLSWVPMLLLIALWIYFSRQMQGGGGSRTMSFGRSRAKLLDQNEKQRVTFADVAGVDEAKEELEEVVDFLSNPKKFTRLGGRIPKGVLLVGPPGTGKTLLSRAVAGEAGVPFFSISGSDFVEMFVGVGASRVRDLFEQGKKNAPCIIFIDEIDAVGRKRGAGLGGGNDEREQTLNQLLVEMDGFEANEGVILIAATNRPDVLDPALLRPGRFDRQVTVSTPDRLGRKQILTIHTKKTPLAKDVNLDVIAAGTPGFSGADLENLVNEAALQAARTGRDCVLMRDFEYAKDKLVMGRERKSLILSDEEKRITAYHEGGHALAAKLLPSSDPVHKVSIIPRGQALGVTSQLPVEDRYGYSRDWLLDNLVVLLGGRVAEDIIFHEVTTGASNDIERVTKLVRRMVCEWGMNDTIGTITVGEKEQEVFIGREWVSNRNYSEETAEVVDREVKRTIDEAYARCTKLLSDNVDKLHAIANALLERETISGDELDLILQGRELPPQPKDEPAPADTGKAQDAGPNGTGGGSGAGGADGTDGDFTFERVPADGQDATAPGNSASGNSDSGSEAGNRPAPDSANGSSADNQPAPDSPSQDSPNQVSPSQDAPSQDASGPADPKSGDNSRNA